MFCTFAEFVGSVGGTPRARKRNRFRLKLENIRKKKITSEKFKGSKSTPSHTRHFKNEGSVNKSVENVEMNESGKNGEVHHTVF